METPGQVPESVNCHTCGGVIPLTGQEGFTHVKCPACGAIAVVPVRFGQYLLLSPMGIGGMGAVYKAMDLPLRRYCAVKILRPKLANDPEFIEHFSREARAAAAVTHNNIAQVYAFGQQDGQYYLAMELLERGSLDDRINTAGTLPEKEVLTIGRQIATGLRAALQRGLLHRDIKPANILFNSDGEPKLVDFGLAHMQETTAADAPATLEASPTVAAPLPGKQIWGTPYYVAPEKLRSQPEDFRSDIYSLGATLFHALAGRPPFEAETADGVVSKQARQPAHSLKAFRPTLQDATVRLVGRMLAKNPAERPRSYDDLIAEFDAALQAVQQAEAAEELVTPGGQRFTVVSLIGTTVVIVACLVAGWLVWTWIWQPQVTAPPPPPETNVVVQPLPPPPPPAQLVATVDFQADDPWVKAWNDATLEFAQAQYGRAFLGYRDLAMTMTDVSQAKRLQWVELFQGLTMIANEHPKDAQLLFRLAAGRYSPPAGADITTDTFAAPLLQALLGAAPFPELDAPAWAAALLPLLQGFAHLGKHDLPAAAAAFQQYADLPKAADQTWAFHLQPLAARLAAECHAPAEIEALQQEQKFVDALDKLRAVAEQATLPYVRQLLTARRVTLEPAAERQRAEAARAREEAEKRQREEEERQRQRAEADAELLQRLEPLLAAAWPRYEFQTAQNHCAMTAAQLQTEAARQQFAARQALVNLLAGFKNQLLTDFAARPFDAQNLETRTAPVSGIIASGTEKEIIVRKPYGQTALPWGDLPPKSIAQLAEFYAATRGRTEPAETLAHRYLLLAVFCRHYGLVRPAAAYAELVEKLSPDLKAQLDLAFRP